MKIGAREQILLVAIGVVVILVAIGAFLVWPQFQKLGELDKQIATARTDVDLAKALLVQREQSKSRAADTDAKWMRLSNLVPEGPDLPSMIIELQDAAFASGVQLVGVTPSAPTQTTGAAYWSVPIQIQIIGTWSDSVDYLQRLLKLNRGLRIVEFVSGVTDNTQQVSKENAKLPDYSVSTAIKIEVYMVPASAAATPTAPVPAPAPKP
jgi:Tfp pilus assembly protein PilO